MSFVSGKRLRVQIIGRLLRWEPGEASVVCWLLLTKALIMITFANILLGKQINGSSTSTTLHLMAVCSTMHVVSDLKAYEGFVRDQLHHIPGIGSINTSFVYGLVKETSVFP